MKGIEKLRDIIYDSIDYIFMLSIVVVVVVVIGWRLDVLFAKDALEMPPAGVIVDNSERPGEPGEDPTEVPAENPDAEPVQETPELPEPIQPPAPPPSTESVKIVIPEGSLPGKIGLILEENGIVSSSRDFLNKVVGMKMDTKLRSGTFTIPKGLSIEEVVRLITK